MSDSKEAITETAIIGGGCFWCTEAVFEKVDGVKEAISGYAGGKVPKSNLQTNLYRFNWACRSH